MQNLSMNKHSRALLITYFGLWVCYFILFWSQAISTDAAGNVVANHANIWGDWAAHFTMGSRMAFDKLILLKSPFIIGESFSYPFISDFISAVLIRLGVSFFNAFIIPSFVFSITIVWALFFFYQKIFKSTLTAILSSLLFLLNGGLGFVYFFKDIIEAEKPLLTALNPPQQYTNIEPLFYRWISVIDSMIIPQRAFSLGFPLTLVALAWCWSLFLKSKNKISFNKLVAPVIILGSMPLIHTHSFLAAFIILATWAVGDMWIKYFNKQSIKKWLPLVVGVAIIAIPIIKIFLFSQVSNQFIKWFPGWYSYEYPDENWLLFWIKNWGFIPLLATLGLINLVKNKSNKNKNLSLITFLPFFIIFILLNLFLFQPFIWDNTKLVVWASVGFSGLAAHFLISMWKKKKAPIISKLLIITLFITSISSGSIDAYRAVRFKLHSHILYSQAEVNLAEWVKNNTDPQSIWLTGDNHNHWLFNLTGRQALMTYRGWLWTHGYETKQVESDVSLMFEFPQNNQNLFESYQVDYVVIGPNERRVWRTNPKNFNHLKLIKASKNYQIYSL